MPVFWAPLLDLTALDALKKNGSPTPIIHYKAGAFQFACLSHAEILYNYNMAGEVAGGISSNSVPCYWKAGTHGICSKEAVWKNRECVVSCLVLV